MTLPSIPANQLVNGVPSVLAAGGNPLGLNAVFMTEDPSIPIGVAQSFSNSADVATWFGALSQEAIDAAVYFSGFSTATVLPSLLYFFQYNAANVAGYLRGGSMAGVTLAALQALTGTITVVIDGVSHVSLAINLAGAGSFTAAAALIQTGLQGGAPATTATVTYDSQRQGFVITSSTTGAASVVGFATANAFTTGLKLTNTTGAVQSVGAVAATPAGACNALVAATQNWATLHLVFDPDSGAAGGPIKLAFAQWISQNSPAGAERFFYAAWDADATPASNGSDSSCFAQALIAAGYNGTMPIWDQTSGTKAAFVAGMVASINYGAPGGAIAFDAKGQAGLVPDVTTLTAYTNLVANGYNFYGAFGTANDRFLEFQTGSMPGVWRWADPYVNQIWLNNSFQLALVVYKTQANKVPYNFRGKTGIRQAMKDTIDQALSNGVIQPGVTLSGSQAQAVITATGNPNAATTLQNLGWLLFVGDASPSVRTARGSPPISFYYTDGGSIRTLQFASIDLE